MTSHPRAGGTPDFKHRWHAQILAVVGIAAFATAGAAACKSASETKPTASPSASTAPAGQAQQPDEKSSGAGQYKVTVDGRDVTGGDMSGRVTCVSRIEKGAPVTAIQVRIGGVQDTADVSQDNQLVSATMGTQQPLAAWQYFSSLAEQSTSAHGSGSVTRNGNSYKISGTIAPMGNTTEDNSVPFEFDVTCP